MPAGEQRHQDLVDDLVLPDDDLADLRQDARAPLCDALGNLRDIGLVGVVLSSLELPASGFQLASSSDLTAAASTSYLLPPTSYLLAPANISASTRR